MRALVITGPGHAEIQDVPEPEPGPGDVLVDVRRAGICGTDIEFFTGEMAYLYSGHAEYPMRIGHEWMGVVSRVGADLDPAWVGVRVTGDTMLGCGSCRRCTSGLQHVCENRLEVGIRGGKAGALAERLVVPVTSIHRLPDSVDDAMGAMVEPGGNAFRAVEGAGLSPGSRCLVLGAGTIGLMCAMFAHAAGASVHVVGRSERSLEFTRTLGFDGVWTEASLPTLEWDAVIEASNAKHLPAKALDLVEPGKRVVYIGLAGRPSLIDTRDLALKDVTAVGVLSASPGIRGTIDVFAAGAVDPRPLIADAVPLEALPGILEGRRPADAGPGPKFHVAL